MIHHVNLRSTHSLKRLLFLVCILVGMIGCSRHSQENTTDENQNEASNAVVSNASHEAKTENTQSDNPNSLAHKDVIRHASFITVERKSES